MYLRTLVSVLLLGLFVGTFGQESCQFPVTKALSRNCAGRCYRRVAFAAMVHASGNYTFQLSRNGFPETSVSISRPLTTTYIRVAFYLLSGYEYRVDFLRDGLPTPKWFDFLYTDNNNNEVCEGGVSLVLPNRDGMVHTIFAAHIHTKAFPVPCPGVPSTFPAKAPQYFDRCVDGASERVLILPVGRMYQEFGPGTGSITLRVADRPATPCVRQNYVMCSVIDHHGVWMYRSPFWGNNYKGIHYDDSSWETGPAPLGYGVAEIKTVIPGPRRVTSYFRKKFPISNVHCFLSDHVDIRARFDDGFALYVNSNELYRENVGTGRLNAVVHAGVRSPAGPRYEFTSHIGNAIRFRNGENVVAIEVHRHERQSLGATLFMEFYVLVAMLPNCV